MGLWSLWDLIFVPAVEKFVHGKMNFSEQKKVNIDSVQLVDIAKDILQKEGWDFAYIDQQAKQAIETRNSWAHFGFTQKLFLLEKNITKTQQEMDSLAEFLRLISAEDAAGNLESKWHKIRNWDDTVLTDISYSNLPRVLSIKFTALFEFYVSTSIKDFLLECVEF